MLSLALEQIILTLSPGTLSALQQVMKGPSATAFLNRWCYDFGTKLDFESRLHPIKVSSHEVGTQEYESRAVGVFTPPHSLTISSFLYLQNYVLTVWQGVVNDQVV